MKKCIKIISCLAASFVVATAAYASVELYALDGRTLVVNDNEVAIYTADGMGWFLEKPVTMYTLDGRSQPFPASAVEAQKKVGWYLKQDLPGNKTEGESAEKENTSVPAPAPAPVPVTDIAIKYTDGTVVRVPKEHLDTYKTLGWTELAEGETAVTVVALYDNNGNEIKVPASEVEKYVKEGWLTVKPSEKKMTVYFYDGSEKEISETQYNEMKKQGWFSSYEEAVYNYAINGNGSDVDGAEKLLENNKYEMSYNTVRSALDKIETSESDFVEKLYEMRSKIMKTWNTAAKSPLGFINYWFDEKNGKDIIVFEYRNVGDKRIKSFRINFDICNADGAVIEKNSGSYFIENLEMAPCDKKKVAWVIEKGDEAKSIKNLKVKEVVFADGTKWTAAG